MAEGGKNPSGKVLRGVPRNVRSRDGALGLGAFYLLLAVAAGAWVATTDEVLMRWLWGALCLGSLALSGMYWVAARRLPRSRSGSEPRR